MSRKPSPETQLRSARTELKQALADRARALTMCQDFRTRATKAEQECAEWKARFDLLLKRTPEQQMTVTGLPPPIFAPPYTTTAGEPNA